MHSLTSNLNSHNYVSTVQNWVSSSGCWNQTMWAVCVFLLWWFKSSVFHLTTNPWNILGSRWSEKKKTRWTIYMDSVADIKVWRSDYVSYANWYYWKWIVDVFYISLWCLVRTEECVCIVWARSCVSTTHWVYTLCTTHWVYTLCTTHWSSQYTVAAVSKQTIQMLWAAPPFPLCIALWENSVHRQHTQKSVVFSLNTLCFGFGTGWKSGRFPIKPFTEASVQWTDQWTNQTDYLWVQVFADVLLQEVTPEDGADRGPVPGVDLKHSVCVCLCVCTKEQHHLHEMLLELIINQ